MSVRPTRKSSVLVALLVILAFLLPVRSASSADLPSPAPAEAAPLAGNPPPSTPSTAQRPLGELLRPDGTLDLNSGYRGSLDPAGWRLAGDAATPRFVPAITPAAPGDEYWADGISLPGMNDEAKDLAVDGTGNLYAGGFFTTPSGTHIAKWDGTVWSPLGSGTDDWVFDLAVDGAGNVYAAGGFTTPSGTHIAKWDGIAWSLLGSGVYYYVNDLALDGTGNVYAGGGKPNYTPAGVTVSGYISKWDGTAWSHLGSGMNHWVLALAVDGANNLYAGGHFTTAGGVSASYIAVWDGTAWSPLGSGTSGGSAGVLALALDGAGNLYAGGGFTTAGGASATRIAKWDGTAWSPLGSGMNNTVTALAVDGAGNLYAGGGFTTAGGASANRIAKWDGTAWSPLGSGMSFSVGALAVDGAGNVYAASSFTTPSGEPSFYIAQWTGGSPLLGIHRQGSAVVLTWPYAAANTSYEIWRDTDPYFDLVSPLTPVASGLPPAGCTLIGKTITCSLSDDVGDPDTNFYVVRGIQAGGPTANSNRTGEFDFALTPGG